MVEFREGDWVHVEFDAVVQGVQYDCDDGVVWRQTVFLRDPIGGPPWRVPGSVVTLVEPDWQPGDVVRDESGHRFSRCGNVDHDDCWNWGSSGIYHSQRGHFGYGRVPDGRLTRVVPEP